MRGEHAPTERASRSRRDSATATIRNRTRNPSNFLRTVDKVNQSILSDRRFTISVKCALGTQLEQRTTSSRSRSSISSPLLPSSSQLLSFCGNCC
ncbi:hypothetical protein Y032_0019g3810 [Ancylostoma ceylanicum]|uniref:Uncharacterized protein n=1 Tax=Ancylostoma ceylanicum TaxID=53326 RepID=A0A016V1T9_9BILA|nr:hypothetical protein Y032_0019g3810 [Ancylostoma ceylanicum]